MKAYAEAFYSSNAWKECRTAYKKSVGGLCERCLKNGLVVAGDIVHHKVHLDLTNVTDPYVTLNFDNLELLCRECHAAEHGSKKRYKVDVFGNVQVK